MSTKSIIEKEARYRGQAAPIYVVKGTLDDFRKLPDAAQEAFIYEALTNFTCRTGKVGEDEKPSKHVQPFIGRTDVSFSEVAAVLALRGQRQDGQPNKDDLKMAEQFFGPLYKEAEKIDATDADGDLWATVCDLVQIQADRTQAKWSAHGGIAWQWQDVEKEATEKVDTHLRRQAIFNLAHVVRGARLARERKVKSESLLD